MDIEIKIFKNLETIKSKIDTDYLNYMESIFAEIDFKNNKVELWEKMLDIFDIINNDEKKMNNVGEILQDFTDKDIQNYFESFFANEDEYFITAYRITKLIHSHKSDNKYCEMFGIGNEFENNIIDMSKNNSNFLAILATEQYNRNKYNAIVKELIDKVDGVDDSMYICEVFDGAAALVEDDPHIGDQLPKRDDEGECDGKFVDGYNPYPV
jgi:hypothetical protein